MKRVLLVLVKAVGVIAAVSACAGAVAFVKERIDEKKAAHQRKQGVYERYIKRPLDCMLATGALICLSPILLVVAILVRIKLGSPVIFTQPRPGKDEKIFKLYKFRTMTDERDEAGNLLSDEIRLTKFGRALRASSCDELPELVNIIKGDMAVIGPRPQLVRDMVFMSPDQRQRHTVRPGLSGLAQVNGRNSVTWEEKLDWDLKYLPKISFLYDLQLIFRTFVKTRQQEGITDGDNATALDYGDALIKTGRIDQEIYDRKQKEAKEILEKAGY